MNNEISERGESSVIDAIRYSMAQGWKGIYYPDAKTAPVQRNDTNSKRSYDIKKAMEEMKTTVPKLKKKKGDNEDV